MKYKIMTIAVASLLPLGFAATASVANPTASHGVTFTVAEARSISVVVKEEFRGDSGELEFGTIAKGTDRTLEDAVTVTFSSPNLTDDKVQVVLQNAAGDSTTTMPGGVTLKATAKTIEGGGGASTPQSNATLQNAPADLYTGLDGKFLDDEFKVNFTLDALESAAGNLPEESFTIRYTLVTVPAD